MNFLTLVPKKVWLVVMGMSLQAAIILSSYYKGVDSEKDRQHLLQQKLVKEQVEVGLKEAQEALEEAIRGQKDKEEIIRQLNSRLHTSEGRSNGLQELLNEYLEQPTTDCDTLPDHAYRLYVRMYNQGPTD